MPEIFIDIHEPKQLYARLKRKTDAKFKSLKLGDVVSGQICIERKTYNDFFNSLQNKRIFSQLHDMLDNYESPYLVLEGELVSELIYSPFPTRKLNSFLGFIVRFSQKLPVLQIERKFYADLVFRIITQKESKSERPVVKRKGRTREEISEDILCSLPDIGRKRAKAILERFGNVEGFLSSKETAIRGIKNLNVYREYFR